MKIHANAIVITMLWASAGIFLANVNSVQAQPDDSQKAVLVTQESAERLQNFSLRGAILCTPAQEAQKI